MRNWLRRWWQETTSKPCDECGIAVSVSDYHQTEGFRKGTWWSGGVVQLECPHCGATFWAKK